MKRATQCVRNLWPSCFRLALVMFAFCNVLAGDATAGLAEDPSPIGNSRIRPAPRMQRPAASAVVEDPTPINMIGGKLRTDAIKPILDGATEDPSPINTFWKMLRSETSKPALDLTEDPGPINTFWKKLRAEMPSPTLDVLTKDPTPTGGIGKRLRAPGSFRNDAATVGTFDLEYVMYVYYDLAPDFPTVLVIAEPGVLTIVTAR
jgi:hypothetical protein